MVKSTLLIGPPFFGYRETIARELESAGVDTCVFDDRPSQSKLFKSISKLDYRMVEGQIDRHFERLLRLVEGGNFDLLLFIGGMSFCFTRKQMTKLRLASSAALVCYLWDSLENCQRIGESLDLFDTRLSFQNSDCLRTQMEFLPLFFDRDYSTIAIDPSGGFKYDACFVGSVHQPEKLRNILWITSALENAGLSVAKYFYMPSRSALVYREVTNRLYRDIDVNLSPITKDALLQLYSDSRVILDSPQGGQEGLTMRTIEALGSHRKIATANAAVRAYDFFTPKNVLVFDPAMPIDIEFFRTAYTGLRREIYERYSVENWVHTVLRTVRAV